MLHSFYVRLAALPVLERSARAAFRPHLTPSTQARHRTAALYTKLTRSPTPEMADVPADLFAFADELADAAGAVIRKYWRTRVEVISKDARLDVFADEPVTIADRESERRSFLHYLREHRRSERTAEAASRLGKLRGSSSLDAARRAVRERLRGNIGRDVGAGVRPRARAADLFVRRGPRRRPARAVEAGVCGRRGLPNWADG